MFHVHTKVLSGQHKYYIYLYKSKLTMFKPTKAHLIKAGDFFSPVYSNGSKIRSRNGNGKLVTWNKLAKMDTMVGSRHGHIMV